jgi:anti-anti-sigma regulatory factor
MKPDLKIITLEGGITEARFSGNLSVKYAKDILKLFKSLKHDGPVTIHIDQPSGIDLCFLQVLYAYKKHCSKSGIQVTITSTLHAAEESMIRRTGFHNFISTKTQF